MAAINKWHRHDSAFAFGFCSRCPSEEYLLELLIDSDLVMPGWAREAIQALISQMSAYFSSLGAVGTAVDKIVPSIMHRGQLSMVCDRLFREETDDELMLLYRLGADVGEKIGTNFVEERQPDPDDYDAVRDSLRDLPERLHSAFDDLVSLLERCKSVDLSEALLEAVNERSAAEYRLLDRIAEKLRRLQPESLKLKKRPSQTTLRNLYFLLWYKAPQSETQGRPAAIRDKWNAENPSKRVHPDKRGREVVTKGLRAAERYLVDNGRIDINTAIRLVENESW